MKSILTKWIPLLVLVLGIGLVGYVAIVDVSVQQNVVEKTIPNDRFFQ